jgi:hypothetical protein
LRSVRPTIVIRPEIEAALRRYAEMTNDKGVE